MSLTSEQRKRVVDLWNKHCSMTEAGDSTRFRCKKLNENHPDREEINSILASASKQDKEEYKDYLDCLKFLVK